MPFRFKQFIVHDDHSSIKVGTDSVLLGAWAGSGNYRHILDIGTGCGLLALMMAQQYPEAQVTAIDIHEDSVKEASLNFSISPWKERLHAQNVSLQEFVLNKKQAFDLIIANPPYFTGDLLPPDPSREQAKHTSKLTYKDLATGASKILTDKGVFALILPYNMKESFAEQAIANELHLQRQLIITPVFGKSPNRIIMEWGKERKKCLTNSLDIRINPKHYSEDYIKLTKDFYLALKL